MASSNPDSQKKDRFGLLIAVLVIVLVTALLIIFMLLPAFRGGAEQNFDEELPRGLDLKEEEIDLLNEPLEAPFDAER